MIRSSGRPAAEIKTWLQHVIEIEYGIEYKSSFEQSLEREGLWMVDVIHVLRNPARIRPDFAPGCWVASGCTVDGDTVEIAFVPKIEADKVKLIKAWKRTHHDESDKGEKG
jgi:hypothetical protein